MNAEQIVEHQSTDVVNSQADCESLHSRLLQAVLDEYRAQSQGMLHKPQGLHIFIPTVSCGVENLESLPVNKHALPTGFTHPASQLKYRSGSTI